MSLTKTASKHSFTAPLSPISGPFWRLPKVIEYTALSRSTLLRKVARKDFPQPVKLSENSVAWPADEVQQWAAARIAARDEVAA